MDLNEIGEGRVEVKDNALDNEIGVQESGNTVAVANEVAKMGEIKRDFELNTQLVRMIDKMMMTAVGK